MIQHGLQIAERLNQLIVCDELEQVPCFVHLIEPLYRHAERVVQEHTELHLDFIEQIYSQTEASAVIAWLEQQRTTLVSLRMQVKALEPLVQFASPHDDWAVGSFRHLLVDLMQGCLSLVEDQALSFEAYGYEGPSVLMQLYLKSQDPYAPLRPFYVDLAKRQYEAVQSMWEAVVEQYARLKVQHREAKPVVECGSEVDCTVMLAVAQPS